VFAKQVQLFECIFLGEFGAFDTPDMALALS